jgi:two-component system sensor histidine kinase TctE
MVLAFGGSFAINRIVESTHDRLLNGSLLAIAERLAVDDGEVTVDLPQVALGMLESQAHDSIYYSVSVGGKPVTGYSDLPLAQASDIVVGQPVHWDGSYRGNSVRIAAIKRRVFGINEPVTVAVAETKAARDQLQYSMLRDLAIVEILLLIVVGLLAWFAVKRGLQPLADLSQQIDLRAIDGSNELRALELSRVPREALAPAQAINSLLERVRLATELLQRFTADASHQMRTPLAALRTHLELLKRNVPSNEAAGQALSEVSHAVLQLERLITQLLSLARADEGALAPLQSQRFDLVAKLASVLSQRTPDAVAREIDLQFVVAEEPLTVLSDEMLVGELLGNIVDNAILYGGERGTIIARIEPRARKAYIEIEDDGPGISVSERERVFDRFYRISRQNNPQGSGLGLAIVRALSERLAADVVLSDGKELGGLCVVISLDMA